MDDLRVQADMTQRICSEQGCDKPHRAKGLCSTHYNQLSPGRHKAHAAVCAVCGVACLKGRTRERVVCSTLCRWFLQNERHSSPVWFPQCGWCDTRLSARTDAPAWCSGRCEAMGTRTEWASCAVRFSACSQCSTFFATPYTTTTCSESCAEQKRLDDRREAKHRRRARQRDAYVANVSRRKIYERDHWTCRLCWEPLDRDAKVPHPKAPTIDHVIPLARGGTHEPDNVQAAHFQCNSIKGASFVEVDQLI